MVILQTAGIEGMAGVEDVEAEEALAEFDFLVSETGEGAGEAQSHGDGPEWGKAFSEYPLVKICKNIFTAWEYLTITNVIK